MITIKNIKTIHGIKKSYTIESPFDFEIDGKNSLLMLPALIDPHVHFRTPGHEYKENWISGAQAAIAGGVTTVFDMPNNNPACVSKKLMSEKISLIDKQLKDVNIPLRYYLYLGADRNHFDEIEKHHPKMIGLKVYMGSTTGNLLVDDDESLDEIFKRAAQKDLLVGVHAECESILCQNKKRFKNHLNAAIHPKIRNRDAAKVALTQAINLSRKYGTKLFALHMSSKDEVDLVREAKKEGLRVFGETTPHHLFFSEKDYQSLGTRIQMNPPIREKKDQEALWQAIEDGVIDTIGTDHAPHTVEEKSKPYGQAPSGIPGIETLLPLLLTAHKKNKISLEKIISLTRTNIEKIYSIPSNHDVVLVDIENEKIVDEKKLKTKCKWSPYAGFSLTGWPVYTILNGHVFEVNR